LRALTDRDQLLMELEAAHERTRAAVFGLGEEQFTAPQLDGWSVRDHLLHMTAMHELRFFEIMRVARGGRATFRPQDDAEMDGLNETLLDVRENSEPQQVIADWEFAWSMVLDAVSNVPEEALEESRYREAGIRGGAAHDVAHAEVIQAWRKEEGL